MADEERKSDEVDELVDDLEAHGADGEIEPLVPDTDGCTGTCTCPCSE